MDPGFRGIGNAIRIDMQVRPNARRFHVLNPARVDAAVDLAYGGLIVLAIVLIVTLEFGIGLGFGLGVFSGYVVHVVWKMARFDPDWMTRTVEEKIGETVDEQLGKVQEQVEAVEERVERRPREDEVEHMVEEMVEDNPES